MSTRQMLTPLLAIASFVATQALAQIVPFTTINVGNGPDVDAADTVNGKVFTANMLFVSLTIFRRAGPEMADVL